MPKFTKNLISWTLVFEGKKIILKTESENFFVQTKKIAKIFLSGDMVSAKIVKNAESGRMAEVKLISLLERSTKTLLGRKKWKYILPLPAISLMESLKIISDNTEAKDGDLVEFIAENNSAKIIKIFENTSDSEVASVLFLNDIPENFDANIKKQEKFLKNSEEKWQETENNFREDSLLVQEKFLENFYKNNENKPYFSTAKNENNETRVDLRNWYTLTIDGADARDLDDAISVATFADGNILLGVHIADVSHFVTEKSPIDHEAHNRGTSIYLPNRVIPMLPETLSNDLCSLNPHTLKNTLTCLMKIDKKTGKVLHTDIFASIIESQHRGIYENIFKNFEEKNFENPIFEATICKAFELFEILKKRRKKEGKITFETTELYFDFDKNNEKTPAKIRKRERNDAHMLIEECMVLANEEVAKWCTKRKIPFLSRVHPEPSEESVKIIENIFKNLSGKPSKKPKNEEKLTPKSVADFLDTLDSERFYEISRMILPKMAKAYYSSNHSGHFGLALENYSHFTSPIRRYPDLATHRMIHAYLERKLDTAIKKKYEKILAKTAEISSAREKRAESVEREIDKIYTLRFMEDKIGEVFDGKIAGVAEWGCFVELEIGVEVTLYFPPFVKYQVDETSGSVIDKRQNIICQIGDKISVKITKIREWRIIASEIKNPK